MSLEPRWSERLSKTGRPEQPLRASTVIIRMDQTIARGITTDVRARGRYFSGFCWAMDRVMNSPLTADLSRADKRTLLEGFEEILALASYRRQQTEGHHEEGLSGITGRSNMSDDTLYEGESVDLSEFTLLDNSPYAIRRFQSTLGHFYLKEGSLALTAAGEELAQSLDEFAGQYFESIVSALRDESVSLQLLDELADAFTHQGCFTSTANDRERDTLQRILLGVVDWNEREQTVEVAEWPSQFDIRIRDHYEYIVSDEHFEHELRDTVSSKVHHLRRAWCLAILRAHQLLASADDGAPLAYDNRDETRFTPIRSLGRVYALQGQLAHALRIQLWGLATHLSHEAPAGVPQNELLSQIESTPIAAEAAAVLSSETTLLDGRMSQSDITHELFRAGQVTPRTYEVTVPDSLNTQYETVGEVRDWLQTHYIGTWRPITDPEVNGQTLIEATENCCAAVESASTRTDALDALGRLIARSTVQLIAAVEQYKQVIENDPLLRRYVENQWGQWDSSLVKTARYLETVSDDTSLAVLARRIFHERVISIHDYVIQDRLGSGSISLVFGTGTEAGDHPTETDRMLFAAGGTAQPGTGTLRYRDLRRLMRDAGLLTYNPETDLWVPTSDGQTVISRFRGEYE